MNLKSIIPKEMGNVIVDRIDHGNKIEIIFNHTNRVKSSLLLPSKIDNERLFFAGLAIFAGEGTNKFSIKGSAREVEVVNSNPAIIRTFVKFLELLGFHRNKIRLRVQLTVSPLENNKIEIENKRCEEIWSKITDIPKENFIKPIIKVSKTRRRKSEFGSLVLRLNRKPLFRLLTHWSKNLDKII